MTFRINYNGFRSKTKKTVAQERKRREEGDFPPVFKDADECADAIKKMFPAISEVYVNGSHIFLIVETKVDETTIIPKIAEWLNVDIYRVS